MMSSHPETRPNPAGGTALLRATATSQRTTSATWQPTRLLQRSVRPYVVVLSFLLVRLSCGASSKCGDRSRPRYDVHYNPALMVFVLQVEIFRYGVTSSCVCRPWLACPPYRRPVPLERGSRIWTSNQVGSGLTANCWPSWWFSDYAASPSEEHAPGQEDMHGRAASHVKPNRLRN
jgi:hypothetical protein